MARMQPVDFPTTHWSLVDRAAATRGGRDALGELLTRYAPALRAYLVRSHRLQPDEADDLLQEFILQKAVRDNLMTHADRRRGRFRTFLLTVLDNFYVSHLRRQHAQRRAPSRPLVSLSQTEYDAASSAPEGRSSFDVEWGRAVIDRALDLMEAECASSDRPDLWGVFVARVVDPILNGREPIPYDQLVAEFGYPTPSTASNALVTSKRMFARLLRCVVGEYARDDEEIEEEILLLRKILSTPSA